MSNNYSSSRLGGRYSAAIDLAAAPTVTLAGDENWDDQFEFPEGSCMDGFVYALSVMGSDLYAGLYFSR